MRLELHSTRADEKTSIVARVYEDSLRIGDDGTIYETVLDECLSCKKLLIALLEIKDLKLISLTNIENVLNCYVLSKTFIPTRV